MRACRRPRASRPRQGDRKGSRGCGLALGGLALLVLAGGGCAPAIRATEAGLLATGQPLVRLVATDRREVVHRECVGASRPASVLGCQITGLAWLGPDRYVRTVRIVRYTDVLPSAFALEIEAHELCHAVAGLQNLADPCHAGNGGVVRAEPLWVPPLLIRRW